MRRDEALAALSRDHHQALAVAQRLRRADAATRAEARTRFLEYWSTHGQGHCCIEEEALLPGYAAYGDAHDPLVLQVLGDHVALRQRADRLAGQPACSLAALHELGEMLATHVRLEERELFPRIEQALPEEALAMLATRIMHAEEAARIHG